MRIAVVASGTRGDVQPMLALAVGLRAAGHEALVCSSPDNSDWARSLGCSFEAIGEPLQDNQALRGWGFRAFDAFIRRQIAAQSQELPRLVEGCEVVAASGLMFGASSVAEALGIGYRFVSFTPASFLGTTHDRLGTRFVRGAADRYADLRYGSALARARRTLGLPRATGVMRQLMGSRTIAATDAALTVVPDGARLLATQTGYPLLRQEGNLSKELREFLDSGPPPLYAGFGSVSVTNGGRLAAQLVAAAGRIGRRLVISRGWAEMPEPAHDDSCLFTGAEPHDQLFPRVAAVLHHGGAGTVATAARAGVPQLVLPAAADQFLWRGAVIKLGLGPRTPVLRLATTGSIATAMARSVNDPVYKRRAEAMAALLADAPDGVAATVAELTGGPSRGS